MSSFQLAGKYKWDRFTAYAGYANERLTDPSDLPAGAPIRRFNGGYSAAYGVGIQNIGVAGGFGPKDTQVIWVGGKFAVLPTVDLIGGYYHVWQNDYLGAAETPTSCAANAKSAGGGYAPQGTANSKCAGKEDAISGVVDWRPYKRVDLYAGTMYSKVSGGLANGFFVNDNLAFTGGVRVSF